jgi:hypothetical protein
MEDQVSQRYEVEPCAHHDCDATVTTHGVSLLKRITDLEAQLEMSAAIGDVAQKASVVSMELVSALQSRIATLETEVSCKARLLDSLGNDASSKLSGYKWRITELEQIAEEHDKQIDTVWKWINQHQNEPGAAEHVRELRDALAQV